MRTTPKLARRALDYLMQMNVPRSIVPFVEALRSKDNVIVNRAAEALGVLGDPEAISPLIDALRTKHKFQVSSGAGTTATFSNSGGGFSSGGPKIIERADRQPAGSGRAEQAVGRS